MFSTDNCKSPDGKKVNEPSQHCILDCFIYIFSFVLCVIELLKATFFQFVSHTKTGNLLFCIVSIRTIPI